VRHALDKISEANALHRSADIVPFARERVAHVPFWSRATNVRSYQSGGFAEAAFFRLAKGVMLFSAKRRISTPWIVGASKWLRMNAIRRRTHLTALLLLGALAARAQDSNQGPMAPPPKFDAHHMSSVPHPGPPPIPEQQIIQTFAQNEDRAKKAFDTYSFTETIRIEELGETGGKFTVVGDSFIKPDGQRYFRVVKPPQSTFKLTRYTTDDVRPLVSLPVFFLTSDQIAYYDFLYAGQQKLDELNTYIFQVKPKTLKRSQRLFQGIIYVDDHDLAIVETYGKFVSEIAGNGLDLPFSMFETYRENFQDKYWLPTYTSSDNYTGSDDQELHLRLVIRDTDFKLNAPTTPEAPSIPPTGSNPPVPSK